MGGGSLAFALSFSISEEHGCPLRAAKRLSCPEQRREEGGMGESRGRGEAGERQMRGDAAGGGRSGNCS